MGCVSRGSRICSWCIYVLSSLPIVSVPFGRIVSFCNFSFECFHLQLMVVQDKPSGDTYPQGKRHNHGPLQKRGCVVQKKGNSDLQPGKRLATHHHDHVLLEREGHCQTAGYSRPLVNQRSLCAPPFVTYLCSL